MSPLRFKINHYHILGHELKIRTLLDQSQFDDPMGLAEKLGITSTQWPFFGLVWPSSLVLAEIIASHQLAHLKILEIGCGVGMAGIMASKLQADITMSDYHPSAEEFLQFNFNLNDLPQAKFERIDWSKQNENLGKFDLIMGSDILYDREHPLPLAQFLSDHLEFEGVVLVIDPSRGEFQHFLKAIVPLGFFYTITAHYADTPRKKKSRFNILKFSKTKLVLGAESFFA